MKKQYTLERDGQCEFFDNYGIPYEDDASILVDNTDGIYNGNIFEFKLNISNLNKTLFQAIKYLSKMRIKGESVPATILLIDLNDTKAYVYKSSDYIDEIQTQYSGSASRDNKGFAAHSQPIILDYSDMVDSNKLKKLLKGKKTISELYVPIDIDESCIVGWGERYYRELPKASKGDFLGDDTGVVVKVTGEIRNPRHFKGLINPYQGKSNEKFKYLMDCLNDRLSKKELGAFYTPMAYAKKAAELVQIAVDRVPEGNDYIILDRCAGSGNLEVALLGLTDRNGDDLISHCVVSTYEYYEYKVLFERIGDLVREIIPPTEANIVYENGKVANADAMSKDFIENPIIKQYIDDPKCTIILFENPPYNDSSAATYNIDGDVSKKAKTNRKESYVAGEFKKHICEFNGVQSSSRELMNLFAWSAFNLGYMRQKYDSYVCFGHVNYYKNVHIYKNFIKGYVLNQKHFHAGDCVTTVILWGNDNVDDLEFKLPVVDIVNDKCVDVLDDDGKQIEVLIRKSTKSINELSNKYDKDVGVETSVVCGADGYPISGYIYKHGRKPVYDDSIIGYCRTTNLKIDALNYALVRCNLRTGLEQSYGRHLFKDNYLEQLPLFVAKLFPEIKWYDKDVYSTTADGGNKYTKDQSLLKSCLIYTCLSNQNKCISFDGTDGRYYKNELCFDQNTIATNDLLKFKLDADEKAIMKLWTRIITKAKTTANYNPKLSYGVYQITKELNTFHVEGTGKQKKNIYDYPDLNGDLNVLRDKLKEYYISHIKDKMFKYELVK